DQRPVGTLVQLTTRVPRSLWQRVRLFGAGPPDAGLPSGRCCATPTTPVRPPSGLRLLPRRSLLFREGRRRARGPPPASKRSPLAVRLPCSSAPYQEATPTCSAGGASRRKSEQPERPRPTTARAASQPARRPGGDDVAFRLPSSCVRTSTARVTTRKGGTRPRTLRSISATEASGQRCGERAAW